MWVLALAVHAGFAIVWVSEPHGYDPSVRSPWREFLPISLGSSAREASRPFPSYTDRRRVATGPPPVIGVAPLATPLPPVAPRVTIGTTTPQVLPPVAVVPRVDPPPGAGEGRIGPRYGQGRVWVRPLPEAPKQLAEALTGRSQAQLADSVVNVMVQVYLDAMAQEAVGRRTAPPSWTTTIAGQLLGLDAKWIYLGPLKIPTALLALLPINLQGNPTQADMNRKLSVMRQDLFEAARRADNLAEFKQAVKELRQEKQRQRDFSKNQRTPPDSSRP